MARTPKQKINEPETEKVEVIEKETKVVTAEETKITTPEVTEVLDCPCELREVMEMALELVEAGKFSAANRSKQGPSFQRRLIAQIKQIIKQV